MYRRCCGLLFIDHSKKTVELSGDKSQVVRQQRTVQQLLRDFSDQSGDLEHIRQTQGRKAYLHAFSSKPDVTAPYHWTSYKGSLHDIAEIRGRLVPADAKLRHAVSQLVTNTWSSKKVGQGNDAVNLHHRGVTVSNVWQIENVSQYKRYVLHMKEAYKHNSTLHIPKVSGLQGEKGIKTLAKGTKLFAYVLDKPWYLMELQVCNRQRLKSYDVINTYSPVSNQEVISRTGSSSLP